MMLRSAGIALLLVTVPALVCAQEEYAARKPIPGITDSLRSNRTSVGFDKSYETLHWTGLARYSSTLGPLSLDFNEQYLSTVILADRNLITDNQTFDLHSAWLLSPGLGIAMRASSFVLSDNKNIGISNAFSQAVYGGLRFLPLPNIVIEPLVGQRYDKQLDRNDQGASYLLTFAADTLRSGGYLTDLDGSFQYDRLSPRVLETYGSIARIRKQFLGQSGNTLRIGYSRNRRDFYLQADQDVLNEFGTSYNIESRTDEMVSVIDSLDYDLSDGMLSSVTGSVVTRQIDRSVRYRPAVDPLGTSPNTGINELRIDGSARLAWDVSTRLRTLMTVNYSERDERHDLHPSDGYRQFDIDSLRRVEERKNNVSRRTTLALAGGYALSGSDSLECSGTGSILHYDTPSEENTDDRDELWYVAGLTTHHHISRYLSLHVTTDLSLTHLVYLSSAMSANNTWNRILRLSPKVELSPLASVRSANTFEVLANFTVYDFEVSGSQTHSYIFRQFGFVDSTMIDLSRRLSVEFYSYLRFYERGELQWNTFAERPVDYFEDRTYIGTVRYSLTPRLHFSVGIRYFSQMRFGFSGTDHILAGWLRSIGPMTGIVMGVGGRTDLSVKGWYERQTQSGQPARGTTTLTMLLNVRI